MTNPTPLEVLTMSAMQRNVSTLNTIANEQYKKHARREEASKKLFDLVYGWGKNGLMIDESAPAFREAIVELLKI